jgi:hypothetical protein
MAEEKAETYPPEEARKRMEARVTECSHRWSDA